MLKIYLDRAEEEASEIGGGTGLKGTPAGGGLEILPASEGCFVTDGNEELAGIEAGVGIGGGAFEVSTVEDAELLLLLRGADFVDFLGF